jgi:hypothetical protein
MKIEGFQEFQLCKSFLNSGYHRHAPGQEHTTMRAIVE